MVMLRQDPSVISFDLKICLSRYQPGRLVDSKGFYLLLNIHGIVWINSSSSLTWADANFCWWKKAVFSCREYLASLRVAEH